MYDRAERFKNTQITSTSRGVGPATYFLPDCFDKNGKGKENFAPFNCSEVRTTSFTNKTLVENPSPKYRVRFRKHRIVGGTSLQNKSPRFTGKSYSSVRGPYFDREPFNIPGKLHLRVPPRNDSTKLSTIPEKGAMGYEMTSHGLVKVYNPPENRPIAPGEYYNPKGHEHSATLQYRGNFWSLRTAQRFRSKKAEGPSPAAYSVNQINECESSWMKYQYLLRSLNKADASLLRTSDELQRKLCREDLPGPANYSPFDPNTKKCQWGKFGSFGTSQCQALYQTTDTPCPATYSNLKTAAYKTGCSVKDTAFSVDADRFPQSGQPPLPGPADYKPQTDMWTDIQKRGHSKYSKWNAPFDTSAVRKTLSTNPDAGCIPSPDWYFPELQKKGDQNRSSMFASKAKRDALKNSQDSPGPAAYSTEDAFNAISNHRSHLQNDKAAFLSSAVRMRPLTSSNSPAPDSYNFPLTTLSNKGCRIGLKYKDSLRELTPGPLDYRVHPKYYSSSLFYTHNITLKPMFRSTATRHNGKKILRCLLKKK